MSLMGYTEKDIERMNEIVLHAQQDLIYKADQVSAEWLGKVSNLLEGLLTEGRI